MGPEYPWYGAHEFAPDVFAQRCAEAFLATALRPSPGLRCIGFKEIRYTGEDLTDEEFDPFFDFIEACFPGAAFICNVRDVADTAKSGQWAKLPPEKAAQSIANARNRLTDFARKRPGRVHLFDYDRLMAEPRHFKSVCDFLEETFDETTVRSVLARRHSVWESPQSGQLKQKPKKRRSRLRRFLARLGLSRRYRQVRRRPRRGDIR